jgi:hypothetical protein
MKKNVLNIRTSVTGILMIVLISCNCNFSTIKTGDISFKSKLPGKVIAGEEVELNIVVDNPKNCEIDYLWETPDGKIEPPSGITNVRYKTPCKEGNYRVICKVVQNKNKEKIIASKYIDIKVEQLKPFEIASGFIPSGWMGDYQNITFTQNDYKGKPCNKITYSPSGVNKWAGIYWLHGQNFETAEPVNLGGYTKLTFWACANGNAKVEFIVGSTDMDSFKCTTGIIPLEKEWKQYTIDLKSNDLSKVKGGFSWVANKDNNKNQITFYLTNIQYETEKCE